VRGVQKEFNRIQKNSTVYKRPRRQAPYRHSGATSALGGSQSTVMRRRRKGYISGAAQAHTCLLDFAEGNCITVQIF